MKSKKELIENYLNAIAILDRYTSADKSLLDFRPDPKAWTIREHILHILDADINADSRVRKAFAQNGTPVITYDEEKWVKNLNYSDFEVGPVIKLIQGLRSFMAEFLTLKIQEDWGKIYFSHPDSGLVDVTMWIQVFTEHIDFHVKLIQRNEELYKP